MSTSDSVSTEHEHDAGIGTGAVVVPLWRRVRFWVVIAALLVAGGVFVSSFRGATTGPLDPSSSSRAGSKALATLIEDYGTPVSRTRSLSSALAAPAGDTVLVAMPEAYSEEQLGRLADSPARLVLAGPTGHELNAVGSELRQSGLVNGPTEPVCQVPGPEATGTVDFPPGTNSFDAPSLPLAQRCYGGAVVLGEDVAVLGSADLLRNDHLADDGVAALGINVLTDERRAGRVVWLLPGSEATSAAAPTYWDLFPDGVRRAFLWLLFVGVLLMLWRGRRFGPVVSEPLPVVVRSAEVIEGHGRLYRRAGAHDRAAAALRAGTISRLGARAGLERGAGVVDVAAALAPITGRRPEDVTALLAGPPPVDDAALMRLAHELDALEAAAGVPPRSKGNRP